MEPNMVLMVHKDRQTTHDSQESFHSENSDETTADMEVRLREQLQQMRKRNSAVEMEKAEAKARVLLLEEQVKNLFAMLEETTRELKASQDMPKDSKEAENNSRLESAPLGTLGAEVTRLQARVSEELALRKSAQYDVIEKSKFICNLQSELVDKEATISKLQMELTLLRSAGLGQAPACNAMPTSDPSPSPAPPSPEMRVRRMSAPAPKSASLSLPHGYSVDRSPASVQKVPSFSPSTRSPARSPGVEVRVPKTAATKPSVSSSAGSIRAVHQGSMSPAMPAQGAGTSTLTRESTAPHQQLAVSSMRAAQSPVVRQYRTQRPGAASACLATRPRVIH